MARKKLTTLQREYNKAWRNYEKRIAKLQSQGFSFEKARLPQVKGKATKARLSRIKSLTEKNILSSRGVTFTTEKGQVLRGDVAKERIRSQQAKERAEHKREQQRWQREFDQYQSKRAWKNYIRERESEHELSREARRKWDDIRNEEITVYPAGVEPIGDGMVRYPDGTVVDEETGEIIYDANDTQAVDLGKSLISGVEELLAEYRQSDIKVVRLRTARIKRALEEEKRKNADALAKRLAKYGSDIIENVQYILKYNDGAESEEEADAKTAELLQMIRGEALSMGDLQNDFME